MQLRVKDVIVILLSLMLVVLVGYTYVFVENYIFDEVLADYLPSAAILLLRVLWTAMIAKTIYDAGKAAELDAILSMNVNKPNEQPETAPAQEN